ncbi:type II toxin-antitoxin system CcdA family antitoxin [Enterococcus raffinosus]|uniref:type II toxin-antitoxin system CcdA family antitoxin n=1 Tax=Enterococcus raffinosus TaxID=71452 RepID=UPI00288C676F|nr:type II toxin-antitoxin system CcdA family antitoxin [Enterococcus raffinosus]MDT2522897.1 type II toxin-antitoxin system CcdA family antitoxin [Enterococcus raffinosus]MDT2532416.1 type II toxin-antitoxin system CcdA family antitoxin [Enterococcus raffinosus]MDT2590251.1 type II toxin-antitoxin system CcdA family antitoxin [Enterococcus raffinosus]
MGRKKLEIKRMNTNVTIREDLKNEAKKNDINLSKLLEKAIERELSALSKKETKK